jgi:Tol biopolymer transport system component
MMRNRFAPALDPARPFFRPHFFARVLLIFIPLLFSACIPEGMQVPESDLLKFIERRSGLIAFIGVDGNIYTINQAGEDQTSITENALTRGEDNRFQIYRHITWSPDSNKIGFIGLSGASGFIEKISVFTADSDGTEFRETYSNLREAPFYLYWAPDSERISFLSSSMGSNNLALQVSHIGHEETQLIGIGSPFYWDWNPNSNKVAVHTGSSPSAKLAIMNLDEPVSEDILALDPTLFQAPAWSPDGSELLLAVQQNSEERTLILTDQNGFIKEELASFTNAIAFAWSPDGEKIAYIADTGQFDFAFLGQLHILDLSKPDRNSISEDEFIEAFFWSPDGNKIAYFVPVVANSGPEASADSQPILVRALYVFDVETGTTERLSVFRPTDELTQIFPYFDQYHHSLTIWSPDSRYLVFSALDDNDDPNIFIATASGDRAPRQLTEGLLAFWSWK